MACLCKSTRVQVALRAFQVPKTCQIHPLHDRQGDFFVKMARRPAAAMFQGEALGLEALRAAGWGGNEAQKSMEMSCQRSCANLATSLY